MLHRSPLRHRAALARRARPAPEQPDEDDPVPPGQHRVTDLQVTRPVTQPGRRRRAGGRIVRIDVLQRREARRSAVGVQQPPAQGLIVHLRRAPPLDTRVRRQDHHAATVPHEPEPRERRRPRGTRSSD